MFAVGRLQIHKNHPKKRVFTLNLSPFWAPVVSRMTGIAQMVSCCCVVPTRCGLQHPRVAADDRQKGPEPFVVPVAGERFGGIV